MVGNRKGRPAGRREVLEQEVCPCCGGLRDAGSLIAWRDGVMCVRCSVEMLEAELHGDPDDFRREARAMNDERRFANAAEAAESLAKNVVRDW